MDSRDEEVDYGDGAPEEANIFDDIMQEDADGENKADTEKESDEAGRRSGSRSETSGVPSSPDVRKRKRDEASSTDIKNAKQARVDEKGSSAGRVKDNQSTGSAPATSVSASTRDRDRREDRGPGSTSTTSTSRKDSQSSSSFVAGGSTSAGGAGDRAGDRDVSAKSQSSLGRLLMTFSAQTLGVLALLNVAFKHCNWLKHSFFVRLTFGLTLHAYA